MDVEKGLNPALAYVREYLYTLVETMKTPALLYSPKQVVMRINAEERIGLDRKTKIVERNHLNPKLIAFAVVSIFIGSTLHAVTPGNRGGKEIFTIVVLTILIWAAMSVAVYLFCRLLNKAGKLIYMVSACVQVYGTIYVVSSLLTLVWRF